DRSQPLTVEDERLISDVGADRRIVALNKSDLPCTIESGDFKTLLLDADGGTEVSALTGSGFDQLSETILRRLAGDSAAERDDIILTDARHYEAIMSALRQLADARQLLLESELEEIVLLKLRAALSALGEITGETLNEDILGQIFATFCIGK